VIDPSDMSRGYQRARPVVTDLARNRHLGSPGKLETADLSFAEEMGRRASRAMHNAHLLLSAKPAGTYRQRRLSRALRKRGLYCPSSAAGICAGGCFWIRSVGKIDDTTLVDP
jgi:hypothetical protein